MNIPKYVVVIVLALITAGAVVFSIFGFSGDNDHNRAEYERMRNEDYRIYTIPVPENLEFAGEKVPLDNPDVWERVDREFLVNTYWHSNAFLWMKRANRWFPVIEPILKKNGIPDDFKYLALVESNFTNAVSPSGAVGFWQFLEETGKRYGLEINDEVDERYNIERSTEAACGYFQEAYARFGEWSLVAGSYNMGINGIQQQMNTQQQNRYWDLLLNEETSRYVCRILAAKTILNNADQYGFVIRPSDLYQPYSYDVETISGPIEDFAAFAVEHSITYKELKMLNPWLRQPYLKNRQGRSYEIKIIRN
ncbi:MAG: hypothetical protein RL220_952 [Bacteroidota bacterium]|jgi:hypothetical protein